jgi:hypothetical protein
MWAFPYPYYEPFFTYHRYRDIMPKRLRDENLTEANWEEQERWINTVGKKVLPLREFLYRGDVFTHYTPTGVIDDLDSWHRMSTTMLARQIRRTTGEVFFERTGDGNHLSRWKASQDHLEVFIPRGAGELRGGRIITPPALPRRPWELPEA